MVQKGVRHHLCEAPLFEPDPFLNHAEISFGKEAAKIKKGVSRSQETPFDQKPTSSQSQSCNSTVSEYWLQNVNPRPALPKVSG
jgi:hypothetical protein